MLFGITYFILSYAEMAFLGNSSGFGRLVVGGIENWLPADRRTAVGWIMAGFLDKVALFWPDNCFILVLV